MAGQKSFNSFSKKYASTKAESTLLVISYFFIYLFLTVMEMRLGYQKPRTVLVGE